MTRTLLATALATTLLAACSSSEEPDIAPLSSEAFPSLFNDDPSSCALARSNDRTTYGEPEDVYTSTSGDTNIQTLYWWSQGRSTTYISRPGEACDITRNTFSRPG